MKSFDPGGRGLFQNDPAHIHKARGIVERFDEDGNDVKSHTAAFTVTSERIRERSPLPSSSKATTEGISFGLRLKLS